MIHKIQDSNLGLKKMHQIHLDLQPSHKNDAVFVFIS